MRNILILSVFISGLFANNLSEEELKAHCKEWKLKLSFIKSHCAEKKDEFYYSMFSKSQEKDNMIECYSWNYLIKSHNCEKLNYKFDEMY